MLMTRFLLSLMLCVLCVGTALGQLRAPRSEPPPPQDLILDPSPAPIVPAPTESSGIDSFITGLLFISIVAFVIVMFAVAARFWVRYSPTTDLQKLAMSDPWTRAYLEQKDVDEDSTLTDPGVGSPNGSQRKQ
jgi:hypothetical protein